MNELITPRSLLKKYMNEMELLDGMIIKSHLNYSQSTLSLSSVRILSLSLAAVRAYTPTLTKPMLF